MIVVDSSALVAIVEREPETETMLRAIHSASTVLISAPTRLETFIVVHRRHGGGGPAQIERLIVSLAIVTVPFDERQLLESLEAFRIWGRGRGRANLNFGDCFSYALAKSRDLPLLFKGEDFRATDLTAAL